jgi:hypothetical protein
VPDIEHPRSRRQRRRYIDHGLAVGDQTLRELDANAAGALDRPRPPRPSPRQPQHVPIAGAVVHDLQRRELLLVRAKHRHRVQPLGWVDADHHCCHAASVTSCGGEPGSPTSSEADPS